MREALDLWSDHLAKLIAEQSDKVSGSADNPI